HLGLGAISRSDSSRARAPRAHLADRRDGAGRSPRGRDRLGRLRDGRLLAGVVLPRAGGPGYLACRSSKRVDHRRVERAASLVGDPVLSHSYGHPLLPYWNAAMLALIYGILAHSLSALP